MHHLLLLASLFILPSTVYGWPIIRCKELIPHRSRRCKVPPCIPIPACQNDLIPNAIFKSLSSSIQAENEPFLKEYILPMLTEMMQDRETAVQIRKTLRLAKQIYAPIAIEMFRCKSFKQLNDVVSKLSNQVLDEARFKLYTESQPIISHILDKHLPMILVRSNDNLSLITSTLDRIKGIFGKEVDDLKNHILMFYMKHYEVFLSDDTFLKQDDTFSEMKKDVKPIKVYLLKIVMDSLSQFLNSWLDILYRNNSFLNKLM